ncbi:MAG: hypothetical protein LBV08_09375 [Clostridiales bacterium]|jgi:uncharacterized protein with FMN-binding domain|nr:hypothetical protein [Clostridiales bacterium]
MGGTKIFVLQMKEIIRTVIFTLIGLVLIIAIVYFLLPKGVGNSNESTLYTPGTYTSQIVLQDNTPIDVRVTVSGDEILELNIAELSDEQTLLYPLLKPTFEELSQEIVGSQTLNVSVGNDDSITKQVLLQAIKTAVNKAIETGTL